MRPTDAAAPHPRAEGPPTTGPAAELVREQQHLAASRQALRAMRERAEDLFRSGDGVAGDGYAAETLGRSLAQRVAALADLPDVPLFFGKLSLSTDERYHIGRRHVTDTAGEPLVLDWRAPVSRAFYQASAADPQNVRVRRRFGFAGGALTSFEDEQLGRGEELGTASRLLTEEIERPRVGPMRDIVATIQPDQDELVRAGIADSVCVQGAPGTGKTAVGLHRAAYLLYQHREQLRRSGVLVVGPNRTFLRYIEAVLPALGELDVRQATMDDLVAGVPIRETDRPEVAVLKHDSRMAAVLRRVVHARLADPTEPLVVPDSSYRWRVDLDTLRRTVAEVRGQQLPYLLGRERLRARIVALLQRQAEVRRAESPGERWQRRIARSAPVTGFLDAVWPALTPQQVLFSLLADPTVRAGAADGLLDASEQDLLGWTRPPRSPRTARWSAADAVLLDEAAGLLERMPSFGHVVVDEAQDLSAMQARALARRSRHGSLTVLGDLAQGTVAWAARDWRETLHHLGKPEARVVPLTRGFRVPAPVLALANRLLPMLDVQVPAAQSLRADGQVSVRQVPDLAAAVVTEVRAALAVPGSVGVICADPTAPRLHATLAAADVATSLVGTDPAPDPADPVGPDQTALGPATSAAPEATATGTERVSVVPAGLAKGLEFDHVVIAEPAEIAATGPRGPHLLYVVLTRAVSRLTVLHRQPLPAALEG